jgi:pimeloyl-ACP methyl ester carboxylesterase
MYQFLDVLQRQYDFDELHVVAHSMGGLVSRGAINLCVQNRNCDYLASYTTISTPWNGVDSASNGVKWAPTVVPVWRDLEPDSEYITTLFDTALPAGLPYHLLFGYRHDTVFGAESSDGVIKLRSQLRHEAQAAAISIRGYDEGHTSILSNNAVLDTVLSILDENSRQ